ncbi:MAG: protein kinase, partial [Planctomycetes bacterium]|nr:protein kinase [Planctomycetota bacterium]
MPGNSPSSPRVLNGRYTLLAQVGEGGLGTLYRAADPRRGADVAVKLLRPELAGPDALAHLRHEFRLLAALDHPGIARVFDFDRDAAGGDWFFTAEFVDGRDLLAATEALPPERIYPLLAQACRALDYVHSRGLVHFDVKPENLIVAGAGREARVKLVDFDLAAYAEGRGADSVKGTVHFIAPEVIRRAPVDRRADLYSLGATMYQVFTRELPFPGSSPLETLRRCLSEPARLPRAAAGLAPPLATLILSLMAKEAVDRPASAAEVVRVLGRLAVDPLPEPTTASATGSQLLVGALVEREAELAALAELRAAALAPRPARAAGAEGAQGAAPALALLVGGAGLGKTRLLRELRCHAQLDGMRVFEGRGRGPDRPLGLWDEVAAQLGLCLASPRAVGGRAGTSGGEGGSGESSAAGAAATPDAAALRRAGPALPRLGDTASETRIDARARLASALLAAASERPCALLFDDLHLADEDSSAALAHLLRVATERGAASGAPVLFVCAAAAPTADGPAQGVELFAPWVSRRLALAPLTAGGSARLIASILGGAALEPRTVQALVDRTGGVPLAIEEALRVLSAEGRLRVRGGAWTCPVEELERAQLGGVAAGGLEERRVRGLDPAARRVLDLLAVADGACPFDRLERVAGLPAVDLDRALLLLSSERLIEYAGERGELRAASGPVVAAARRLTDAARGASDHGLLADELLRAAGAAAEGAVTGARGTEPGPEIAETVARHLEQAGRSAEASRSWLVAARAARGRGAWEAALRAVERAATAA